ncbi:MAG: V-type ATP synthase subunit E [Thermodesulfobacteriota bacterium]
MGHEELLRALENDSRRERDALLENAQKEAGEILAAAEKRAEKLKEEYLKRVVASRESERARRLNTVRKEAQETLLKTEHEIISRVFREVERRFPAIDNYDDVIRELFREAIGYARSEIGEESFHVYLSMSDVDVVKELVKPGESSVMLIPLDGISCGVVISRPDGKAKYINTLSSRLERAKMRLMPTVRGALFEEG